MKVCKVYGASDDLVEVEGAISAEFQAYNADKDAPVLLGFSDGTLLRVWYDEDGIWRIVIVARGEGSTIVHEPGDAAADLNDGVTIRSDALSWVVLGSDYED